MMKKLALPLALVVTLIACQPADNGNNPALTVEQTAETVLVALNTKDMAMLASYVHPVEGVRLSPYSYVDPINVVLMPNQLASQFASNQTRIWGIQDGSGEPINMTFKNYYDRYLWEHDYTQAPDVTWDSPQQRGNIINNIADVYPGLRTVEYHFDGFDPQYGGMDWRSLNLVFEEYKGEWKLVGIVHDEWTI